MAYEKKDPRIEEVRFTWAVDRDGNPTNEPESAIMTVNYALVDSTTGKRHPVREDVPIDLEKQAADKKVSAFARLIARLV